MEKDGGAAWHLDKRVNISLRFGLIAQAVAVGWWGSGITVRVARNEVEIAALDRQMEISKQAAQLVSERMARLEEQMRGQTVILERIEHLLSEQYDQRRNP